MGKRIKFTDGMLINNIKLIEHLGNSFPSIKSKQKARFGIFECPICGKHFKSQLFGIKNGNTKSCGCIGIKKITARNTTHGLFYTRLRVIRANMIQRCYNKNHPFFKHYGGRGITICDEWMCDLTTFYNWAMKNGYQKNLIIDRENNNGNYEPSNCRWITYAESNNNKRVPNGYKI